MIELKILNKEYYDTLDKVPRYATAGSGAIDLVAVNSYWLCAGGKFKIPTGIAIYIKDPRIVGMILPRSGLSSKGLVLTNTLGLIDSDYQGELILSVWNHNNFGGEGIQINPGDRIAQLVFVGISRHTFNIIEEFSETTERGEGGFGSTGV